MTTSELVQLRKQALSLDEKERARLARDLVSSLDGAAETDVEKAWDEEIVKRIHALDYGNAELRDATDVVGQLKQKYS